MNEQVDWQRLARYVSGNASADEKEIVRRWAAGDAQYGALLASVERRWRGAGGRTSVDVDAAWQRVAAGLRSPGRRSETALPIASRWPRQPWMFALAATLLFAVAISSRLFVRPTESSTSGVLAGLQASTTIGERRTVVLPDSSEVLLGVHSTLHFEPAAAGAPRIVHLDGEAFFTVRHDAARPFRVLASDAVIEDVGTEFSVRAYSGDSNLRVAVREGAVSLYRTPGSGRQDTVLLARQDVATIAADGVPHVTSDAAIERLFAWTDGELMFDDASLAEVANELSRWYDVEFRFADPALATRHLTSRFASDPIDDILRVIGLSAEVRFERHGRVVTVRAASRTSLREPMEGRASRAAVREVEGGV
ncbi:MAG: hypothetical protein MNPFHGCM_00287 [Gemmatimonadaceae bacterium]|nr:hypothetical protein [Gemmatimonadaceae bacterium]